MNIALEVANVLMDADPLTFESFLRSNGIQIVGVNSATELEPDVSPAIVESISADITESALEFSNKSRLQRNLQELATRNGFVTKVISEKSPPGWEHTVEAMKKHMSPSQAFARAWAMYKKGAKPHYGPHGKEKNAD